MEPDALTGYFDGVAVDDAGGAGNVRQGHGREREKDYGECEAEHWGMIGEKSPDRSRGLPEGALWLLGLVPINFVHSLLFFYPESVS